MQITWLNNDYKVHVLVCNDKQQFNFDLETNYSHSKELLTR